MDAVARLVVCGALVSACSLLTNLDELGSTTDAMGDSGSDVTNQDAPISSDGGCPTGLPAMVPTPLGFCIDSTEVTRAEYADFLNSGPSIASQTAVCAFNTSFLPTGNWPDTSSLPVVNVNWCDAFAYCAWAGKRLCGARQGGTIPSSSINDPAQDQWFAACTHDGTRAYPYGNAYDASVCNGSDLGLGGPEPVGTQPGCVGGYPGMFDMSGNVWEWRDSCVVSASDGGSAKDTCVAAGGAFTFVGSVGDASDQMECRAYGLETRGGNDSDRGFRCCSQ